MVRKLVRLELSEAAAKAAVQKVGYHDTDDCLIWALSNSEEIEELARQFDDELGTNVVEPFCLKVCFIVSNEYQPK